MRLQIVLLAIVVAMLAYEPAHAAEKTSWWSRLWSREKAAPPKNDVHPPKAEVPTVIPSREKEVWLRRAEICQKLREIALTNNDDALLRKADQLDQRAWDTYLQRISTVRSVADGMVLSANESSAGRKSSSRKGTVEDEP